MPRRVKGPDGVIRNFPDDASDDEIAQALEAANPRDSYKGPDTFADGFSAGLKPGMISSAKEAVGGVWQGAKDIAVGVAGAAKDAGELALRGPVGFAVDRYMKAPSAAATTGALRTGANSVVDAASNPAQTLNNPARNARIVTNIGAMAAGPGVVESVNAGMNRGGVRLMQSALKPSQALVNSRAGAGFGSKADIAQAVLDEGRTVSAGGLTKAQAALDATDAAANARIHAGAGAGVNVDAFKVAQAIDNTGGQSGTFGRQINAAPDVAAIQGVSDNFLSNPHLPQNGMMPADLAHDFATNTGRNLKGKFGRLGAATVEAEKAGRQEIVGQLRQNIPELSDLWNTEARQITVRDALEGAVERQGNRDPIGLGGIVGAVKNPALAVTAMADRGGVAKSLVARALANSPKASPQAVRFALLSLMKSHGSEPAENPQGR